MLYDLVRPFWFSATKDDPEAAHELALEMLRVPGAPAVLRFMIGSTVISSWRLLQTHGSLTFKNPVGLAAGFDKDAVALPALQALGFGFLNFGAVVPEGQFGNPRPRMFRLPEDRALINRMGFNSHGCVVASENIAHTREKISVPIIANLGKNKNTPLEKAADDYVLSAQALAPFIDIFSINVSSPNTPELRKLQGKEYLRGLLREFSIFCQSVGRPWLIKIAPDFENGRRDLDDILEVCSDYGAFGIEAVNTTVARDGLKTQGGVVGQMGGLSGAPLYPRALDVVRYLRTHAPNMFLAGIGGIDSPEKAYEMLQYADVVELFTGLVYKGPTIVPDIITGLLRLMDRDGVEHISEIKA